MNNFTNYQKAILRKIVIIFTLVLCFNVISKASTPDSTWFTNVSHVVGFDNTKGVYIQWVDINGDNYPDLLWGTSSLVIGGSNTFYLYENIPNPDTTSPYTRIFKDITAESGIMVNRNPGIDSAGYDIAVMADLNNDGFPDLVTSTYYHRLEWKIASDNGCRPEVYLNDGTGHFTLVKNSGLNTIIGDSSLLTNSSVKNPNGLIDGTGISFLDYDLDGKLDIFLATKFTDYANSVIMRNILMKGNGDGTFVRVYDPAINGTLDPLYGVNVTDWNNDGWQDIITSPYCRSGGNIFKNSGNGTFSIATDSANYSSQHTGGDWLTDDGKTYYQKPLCQWAAPPADFDNDGDMDLLQCLIHGGLDSRNGIIEGHTNVASNSGSPDYRYEWDLDRLHRTEGTTAHLGDYGASWLDLENRGWQDILLCEGFYNSNYNMDRFYVLRQDSTHQFQDITKALGMYKIYDANQVIMTDYDLDGANDFAVSYGDTTTKVNLPIVRKSSYSGLDSVYNNSATLYRIILMKNNIGLKNNWTAIKLTQPKECNQSGIGSRIYVYSNGIAQIHEIQAGLGHFGGEESFIKNFGLAQNNRIDSIVVRWQKPGFPKTIIYNPPMNCVLNIAESGLLGIVQNWRNTVPLITLSAPYLSFGEVATGNTAEKPFTIKNIGTNNLVVSDLYIQNDTLKNFSIKETNKSFTLTPGESATYTIVFAPTNKSDYPAIVTIKSNANNCPLKSLDLYGNGLKEQPMLSISKNILNYDTTWIDTIRTKTVTLKNYGELPLHINNIRTSENYDKSFSYSGITTPFDLPAGDSVNLDIVFKPQTIQAYYSELIISSNAYNKPNAVIALTGACNGPDPIISVNQTTILFGSVNVGESKDKYLVVSNSGNANLNMKSLPLTSNSDKAFSITDPAELPCSPIAPDKSSTITIHFAPTKEASYSVTLKINSDATNTPALSVTLVGKGNLLDVPEFSKTDISDISLQVFPNPVTNEGRIVCKINGNSIQRVRMSIIDPTGKEVAVLKDEYFVPDIYDININVNDLASGVYYLVARSGNSTAFQPITVIK